MATLIQRVKTGILIFRTLLFVGLLGWAHAALIQTIYARGYDWKVAGVVITALWLIYFVSVFMDKFGGKPPEVHIVEIHRWH